MLFTSLEFLFLFFPIVLGVYFVLNEKARNYWLLLASLFFYAWGEPKFVMVMIASILFNYVLAFLIHAFRGTRGGWSRSRQLIAKVLLGVTVLGNCSLLFAYKYLNFVTGILREWVPSWQGVIPQTSILLPIGISFFTFQAMSYVIDVYRGVPVQKNPFYLGLYIALFPQLIAGPIVRYTTVQHQIEHRQTTLGMFAQGVLRFLYGFNKKMLLANLFAVVADKAFNVSGAADVSIAMAWLGAICYTLQIYFDFSGYSEMAIGLGLMFGFNLPANFNYPYIAKTSTEFWRRWHISLGTWFRDYVYFPLGGSRVKNKFRLGFNLFVTWFVTGIWHGANWTFMVWGALYGTLITMEKFLSIPQKIEKKLSLRLFYQPLTMLAVILGWVVFRSENLTFAISYIKKMFFWTDCPWLTDTTIFEFGNIIVLLLVGILCSTPILKVMTKRLAVRSLQVAKISTIAGYAIQFLLFLVSVSFLVMNAHNPFIYFNF